MDKKFRFETLQLHAGQEEADSATGARAVPIYATTSYLFDSCQQATDRFSLAESGNIYSRISNPTTDVFEKRLAALEGGVACVATASGSAATTLALQNLVQTSEHIVAASQIYGGSYNLLRHTFATHGIESSFVPIGDLKAFEQAIQKNTRAIFVESIGNPNADLADLSALSEIAKDHRLPLVVDNTFATPYALRPLEHGANVVIHSATKFIGGHGTVIGGAIVDGGNFDWSDYPQFSQSDASYHGLIFTEVAGKAAYSARLRAVLLRDYGPSLSPFHSFLFLQGLETLSLRVERHIENTLKVVDFLVKHPAVELVNHPSLSTSPSYQLYQRYFPQGGCSIFTVVIKGGEAGARRFIDRLQLFSLLANVADGKSLVIHPASTTHSQMNAEELIAAGIEPGTVRLSIGTEHCADLIEDLEQALA